MSLQVSLRLAVTLLHLTVDGVIVVVFQVSDAPCRVSVGRRADLLALRFFTTGLTVCG